MNWIDHTVVTDSSDKQIEQNLLGLSDETFCNNKSTIINHQLLNIRKDLSNVKCDSAKKDDPTGAFYVHNKNIVAAIDPTYASKTVVGTFAAAYDGEKDKMHRNRGKIKNRIKN